VAVCPVKTVEMKENKVGFLEPICSSECNNCGICTEVCPVIHEELINTVEPLAGYSAWSNSPDTVVNSSSGGIFYEIARFIMEAGGKVSGAVMLNNRVHHITSNNFEDLKQMRGSKYIQSKTINVFLQIGELASDSTFLFSGTPCQVAAIKNLWAFHNHDSEKLITCDLICHGVPSYLLFDRYMQHYSKNRSSLIVDFRDKTFSWQNYAVKILYRDGKSRITPSKRDIFMRSYLTDIALRESCYKCRFSRIPRVGDVTLGDFWGVPDSFRNDRGTSAIIVNSEKGEAILNKLSDEKLVTLNKVDLNTITRKNRRVLSGMIRIPRERVQYLEALAKGRLRTSYLQFVFPIWLLSKMRGGVNRIKGPIKKLWGGNG
jgi:coenzyme F420-reducing hydrogenase beta subunit